MNSRRQLRFIYISLTGAWAFSTLAFALLSWAFVRISQLERKQHDLQVYVQALAQRPPKVDVHIGSPIEAFNHLKKIKPTNRSSWVPSALPLGVDG